MPSRRKSKMKLCTVCHLRIKEKTDYYYEINLFEQGKKTGTDYAHVDCHHEALKQSQSEVLNKVAGNMIRNIAPLMKQIKLNAEGFPNE